MFPTSGEIQWFMKNARHEAVADALRQRHPHLGRVVRVSATAPEALIVDLPPARVAGDRRVLAGITSDQFSIGWVVAGGATRGLLQIVLPLASTDAQLADAVADMYRACLDGGPLSSPTRWAQVEESMATVIADELTDDVEVEIRAVVASHRLVPPFANHWNDAREAPAQIEEAVALDHPKFGEALLWRRSEIGWTLDVGTSVFARRLDLRRHLGLGPASAPGWVGDDIALLAGAVRSALTEDLFTDNDMPLADWDINGREFAAAYGFAWWMRHWGFDVSPDRQSRTDEVLAAERVLLRDAYVNLAQVQREFADATVEQKKLWIVSTHGFTRDATRWADRAGVVLFGHSAPADKPYPANDKARAIPIVTLGR